MIEATVHAPTASRTERAAVYGVAAMLVLAGLLATNAFPIASTLLIAGLWVWLVAPFLLKRRRAKKAKITANPGFLTIHAERSLPRKIHTRDLAGASVARHGNRAVVTLAERSSKTPLGIEVDSERDADRIRTALGIPHGGFGEITWDIQPKAVDMGAVVVRAVAALSWLLVGVFMFTGATTMVAASLMPAIFTSCLALASAAVRFLTPESTLRMTAEDISVQRRGQTARLRYVDIGEIVDDGSAILVRRNATAPGLVIPCAPTSWLPSGLRAEERALMLAQLRGALAAAHGEVAPFVDPTLNLDPLRRGEAPAAEWLARLDALAATHENTAYRSTTLAKDDLWRVLESHDAARDVRAGAARVLLRISAEKEQDRIAAAIDSIHDDRERAHIRAALRDDVEQAASEIDECENVFVGDTWAERNR